jgi:hypothetical protein
MLLPSVVTERNLTECESNCLEWRDAVQFCRQVYVTAPRWCISIKIARCQKLEDSNFHIQCITIKIHYAQKPLNISEYLSKIKSFGMLNVSIRSEGYCKLLLLADVWCVWVQLLAVDLYKFCLLILWATSTQPATI